MDYHDAGRHQSHGDDGKRDQDRARAISCRSEPADQADVCHDHDSLPQLEVGDLFLKPIEFRHGCPRLEQRCQDTSTSPYAPSNVHGEGRAACGASLSNVGSGCFRRRIGEPNRRQFVRLNPAASRFFTHFSSLPFSMLYPIAPPNIEPADPPPQVATCPVASFLKVTIGVAQPARPSATNTAAGVLFMSPLPFT